MAATFPARLHVLMASVAPVGVVIRRGPAKSVCTILWNRRNDEFELGQWLRGRIYERRADISPNGRYLIYFAMSGKWGSETKGSWTAISRAPWLKATTLWGKGDCWHGGGLFTSNKSYWLNGDCGHFLIRDAREVRLDQEARPANQYGGECRSVYYVRLQRDGWKLATTITNGKWNTCTVFEKELRHGWTLRKFARAETGAPPGKGCYWDEHELENSRHGQRVDLPNWEWADRDGRSLVWAENGCLKRASLHAKELGAVKVLLDANGMKFEARPAPY